MRTEFTIYTNEDLQQRFGDAWDEYRWGGALSLTLEAEDEVMRCFGSGYCSILQAMEPRDLVACLDALPHVVNYGCGKRHAWYEVHGALDVEYAQAYYDAIERKTGYRFPAGHEHDLTGVLDVLDHRHILTRFGIEHEHFVFEAFNSAQPWNKKTASDYAEHTMIDSLEGDVGHREVEEQYTMLSNGHFVPNPKYGSTRHRAGSRCTNDKIHKALMMWWLEHEASGEQKDIIQRSKEERINGDGELWRCQAYGGIHYDNWTQHVSFEQFAAMR